MNNKIGSKGKKTKARSETEFRFFAFKLFFFKSSQNKRNTKSEEKKTLCIRNHLCLSFN